MEKRRQYRVEPGPRSEFIEVYLRQPNGETCVGKVIDTTVQGVAVIFRTADAPELEQGETVGIAFRLPGHPEPVALRARPVSGRGSANYRRYSFEFEDSNDLDPQVDGELWKIFNRRSFRRLQLGSKSQVQVAVHDDGTGNSMEGTLADLSCSGICVSFEGDAKARFAQEARMRLSFTVPGTFSELEYVGMVSNERNEEGRTLIGFAFDSLATENAAAHEEVIEDWLASLALETW